MPNYAFFECTNPACRLRFPLDTHSHRGEFCPLCGGELQRAADAAAVYPQQRGQVPKRRISAVLDNLRSAFNVGGIFRTADGVGLEHLYLCGITPNPTENFTMSKTALGAEQIVSWSAHKNALSVIEALRENGFLLLGLERAPGAIPLQDFPLTSFQDWPIALVIGHERAGVDPQLLSLCDAILALPMAGRKASLNVAVAFGAAAYWLAFH